jgi:PAS domain S-box-containing protein
LPSSNHQNPATPPAVLLRAILESASHDAIIATDLQGQVTFWNSGAEHLLGWGSEEMIGKPADILFTESDRAAGVPNSEMDGALVTGRGKDERWHQRRDGSCLWASSEMMPLRNEIGEAVGFLKIVRDRSAERLREEERLESASALKTAQQTLRESEARLRIAVDAGQLAIWDVDLRANTIKASPVLNRILGFPEDACPTLEEIRAGYAPGEQERVVGLAQEALARGDQFIETEFQYTTPDGQARWLLVRAEAQLDRDGTPSRYIGVVNDITRRKRVEQELQRLNETLEREVEARTEERDSIWLHSNDMMAVMEFNGRRRAINPAWSRILGFDEETLLTAPFFEITHPDDRERLMVAVQQLKEGKPIFHFEDRLRHKDGGYRTISWTGVPGEDVFYAIGRDVTDQRATEEALRQSQKMEAVGQLTGGIAHDFNNLLQGIVGSLGIVQRRIAQGRAGDAERFITAAMTSANRAAALTHRLLAFSRRQPLDPKPVKANHLVASMEDLLRRTIGEQIDLELVLAGGLWPTICDPNQLESAILNIVINARDAMPRGGKLTIETCNAHLDSFYAARTREVEPGQYVCICVSDTGTGMSREVMDKAFDPFFTTKLAGQGTGLGLSMVYGFIRQSDGYAKIYSEEGQGTTVKLYLPRFRGTAEDDDPVPELLQEHHAHEGEVVVVVEDEPVVRGLIVEVLSELGYQAWQAADGPSGLRLLERVERVDLLVTDIGLPGLNGRQLADAARAKRPGLKVLFITGYAQNATLANGFLEPGMEMITKPVSMEVLATRIRKIIEG